jgi:Putative DNA-binding domain
MTTRQELLKILDRSEDNFVERKPARANAKEIRQTLVAFANSVPEGREAVLFIGVHDNGSIEGCPSPDSTQKLIADICSQQCYPPIAFKCEVLEEHQNVVAVMVPVSRDRPHFSGPAFVRKGATSKAASREMFDELVYSRTSKVAALLKLRDAHAVITVVGIGHKLGAVDQISDRNYKEAAECKVIGCDPHSVHLFKIGSHLNFSEPLDHVHVSHDHEKHRTMLVISGY